MGMNAKALQQLERANDRIDGYAARATTVFVSHYHEDHFRYDPGIYRGKTVWAKDPKRMLGEAQGARAAKLWKGLDGGCRLDSAEGRALLRDSKVLGFVEGTSVGRVSARNVSDPPSLFNLWRRQDFDQPPGTTKDGGRVWEHWCTLRDIRPSHAIGTSVLTAYVSLVSALGDLFIPSVARGRREYGHPDQLRAMVRAGLVGRASATWDGKPDPISKEADLLFQEADEAAALKAVEQLKWSTAPQYYMFARKISGWSKAEEVKEDISTI